MTILKSGSCEILFNANAYPALSRLLSDGSFSKVFLLVDSNTRTACLPVLGKAFPEAGKWEVLEIPAGESFKTLHTCLDLWKQLASMGADRKSLLINLGGGVVTDLGGFVASAYQRGIRFVNIPTTLLAMVDASVGGKTGVDLGNLKNQIGVINNPELVLIQPEYLKTLDERQIRSGFAEMLKHGLILDRPYWDKLKDLTSYDKLNEMIFTSVALKKDVVEADPREQGLRKILNFGHTLGHAIESHYLSNDNGKALLHGEAIAAGMVMEAYLSAVQCGMPMAQCEEVKATFFKFFPKVDISERDQADILSLLRYDKKNVKGHILFALLREIGKAQTDQEVSADQLHACFDYYRE